jgi:hypothetical protein
MDMRSIHRNGCLALLAAILLSSIPLCMLGQEDGAWVPRQYVVYMTNGSVLRGEVEEWNADYILLYLSGSETSLRLATADVVRIISRSGSGTMRRSGFKKPLEKTYEFPSEGIYHVTTMALSAGPSAGLGVTHVVGHRFSTIFGLGAGTGVETFAIGSGRQFVPVFGEARGYMLKQRISPYYAVRAGYGFALRDRNAIFEKVRGGASLGAELGYRFGGTRPINFFAGAGFHLQKSTNWLAWPWQETIVDRIWYRRTELRFGLTF